ncbi:MAG: S-layer homology domain-containing protein [Clostridia bacterium]|nr:S-layer homology domain-containing protein [Clostridia bacterium]
MKFKKQLSVFLIFAMLFGISASAFDTAAALTETAEYLMNTSPEPQIGSVGGDWTVMGLARSDAEVPDGYYEKYRDNAAEYIKSVSGVLHGVKYTEYSRVILALTAIGQNPSDIGGYNLLMPLGDYEKTVRQGINGSIWALTALDSGGYEIPINTSAAVQATRELYIKNILDRHLADGGWAMAGEKSDPDATAMALQALAKYTDREDVSAAVSSAVEFLSLNQTENGAFTNGGTENSESCAQVLTAMCELGIPLTDGRFVKNGNTVLDAMMSFYVNGGGFRHTPAEEDVNLMSTEQCFYALAAAKRADEGKSSLYRMSDTAPNTKEISANKMPIVSPGRTFSDISDSKSKAAIEALAERNIINGKTENAFEPNATMTRAEFAAITVRGLGLSESAGAYFDDVTESDWFYGYVNTAYDCGIVNGVSETEFCPNGTITREEAAAMTARAAGLCGMNTAENAARDILAGFSDYVKVSDWALKPLAFCVQSGILSDEPLEIKPKEHVTRAEIAEMLYNMLVAAQLL